MDLTAKQLMDLQSTRVDRIKNQLDIFNDDDTPKNSEYVLRKKLTLFDGEYAEFKATHDRICIAVPETNRPTQKYFSDHMDIDYERVYFDLLASISNALKILMNEEVGSQINSTHFRAQARIKLPALQPPKFSGKYTDWHGFSDQFDALFHTNAELTPVQKMQYLLAATMDGPAFNIIKHLPVTGASYEPARILLKKRYENKRCIFMNAVAQLLSLEKNKKESVMELQFLITTIHDTIQSFKNVGLDTEACDALIAYLIIDKLPTDTRKEFEKKAVESENLPSIADVERRIQNSLRTLELINSSESSCSQQNQEKITKMVPKRAFHLTKNVSGEEKKTESTKQCSLCSKNHSIRECTEFLKLSTPQRSKQAESMKLCFNCLSPNHMRSKCFSKKRCQECGYNHHTLLHQNKKEEPSTSLVEMKPTEQKSMHVANIENSLFQTTLLATALAKVYDMYGSPHILRILVDLGGEASAISSAAVQLLKLNRIPCNIDVTHLGTAQSQSLGYVSFAIESRHSTFTVSVDALVMKTLTKLLPSKEIFIPQTWTHFEGLTLADPDFNKPGPIDIILGAEVCAEIFLPEIRKGEPGSPIAHNTELGWILFGKAHQSKSFPKSTSMNVILKDEGLDERLDDLIEKFWEIENIPNNPPYSREEQYCIDHFEQTFRRKENGSFVLKLPFRKVFDSSAVLGRSYHIALKQFILLEKKFAKDADFKAKYAENINDYIRTGHMTEFQNTERDCYHVDEFGSVSYHCFYLPHHPVITESPTTPVRIVFNASKRSSNNKSLNDIIFPGPALQRDLIAILLNWRFHRIAFVADIQKMYRMIHMDKGDQSFLRILWRDNPNEEIKEYGMNRLTFGLNYAPCGAIQTMNKLAEQNEKIFPEACEAIKNDTYMDDTTTGSHDIHSALQIQRDLINILQSAGFHLKKWASNSEEILEAVPESNRLIQIPLSLNPDKSIKTLGLLWTTSSDVLHYRINYKIDKSITKRFVVSTIAKIYDPLGFIAPIICKAKIFIKQLWIAKLNWDDPLPDDLLQEWIKFASTLPSIANIKLNRWIGVDLKLCTIQLHGFSDACFGAYGAVIYIRRQDLNGNNFTSLIISKSRIAPSKNLTIPRLELMAAVLLTDLICYTVKAFRFVDIQPINTFYWTDSQVVLHWLNGDSSRWKTFVSNRIDKIKEKTDITHWNYVPTKENPADFVSRGLYPSQLSDLWFKGPCWLINSEECWPKFKNFEVNDSTVKNEAKIIKEIAVMNQKTATEQLLNYCSSYNQLIHYTAWFRRFFIYLKNKSSVKIGLLSIEELKNSNLRWIQFIQNSSFKKEIDIIRNQQDERKIKHLFWNLNPFIDPDEILRVGGRLKFADISYNEKHPIILPRCNHFTRLLIEKAHKDSLHGGSQLTLSYLRQNYWILKAKKIVSSVIKDCIQCHRNTKMTSSQLMADLPPSRVSCERPFLNTGMDLCGPILIRRSKSRGSKVFKGYIVLFICMATKAVHLEPVTDMTSETFLMAFQRFISRRGLCSDLFCDNGSNFIGAKNIMDKHVIEYLEAIRQDLQMYFANKGVRFHINPPAAPSFGGLWEANIKRVKHHLKRVLGDKSIPFDELATLLTRIEAILNSRPLVPMSDDPGDFTYLTPGHFLIGGNLNSLPEPAISSKECVSPNSYYKVMQQKAQHFWRLFRKDYLQSLQQRPKWLKTETNLKIGDVVLVKEDNLPPLKWMLGRIEQTIQSPDGLIRICSVRTANGTYLRPILKLSLLPIEEHSYLNHIFKSSSQKTDFDENSTIESSKVIAMFQISIPKRKYSNILIEGNIGSGKSSLMRYLQKYEEIKTFLEPLDKWTNLNGHNLLELMYSNPKEWSFGFQNYAALTTFQNHMEPTESKVKIMERSLFSGRHCFLRAALHFGNISSVQANILEKLYDHFETSLIEKIDLIIYLRTSPDVIMNRIQERGREEERSISMEYLKILHQFHDDWLINNLKPQPAPILTINGDKSRLEIIEEYRFIYNMLATE